MTPHCTGVPKSSRLLTPTQPCVEPRAREELDHGRVLYEDCLPVLAPASSRAAKPPRPGDGEGRTEMDEIEDCARESRSSASAARRSASLALRSAAAAWASCCSRRSRCSAET